jgi:hypothetical protein
MYFTTQCVPIHIRKGDFGEATKEASWDSSWVRDRSFLSHHNNEDDNVVGIALSDALCLLSKTAGSTLMKACTIRTVSDLSLPISQYSRIST